MSTINSPKLEVQWSPVHHNKFITWGTEICLYEVGPLKDNVKPTSKQISDNTVAHQLATNSSYPYVRCVDIYPHPVPDILLAVGLASGKIILTTFGPTAFDASGLTGKELAPKHARQCNAVAWNPADSNLLISGLDKYRADYSLLLWDVVRTPSASASSSAAHLSEHSVRPLSEAALSEAVHSLCWFKTEPRCCIAGINGKHLKIFDFRDSNRIINSTTTKAVYGVAVNPHNCHHIVSTNENQITLWDTRYFEKPVLTLPQNRHILKVLWCPTRHNLLGSIQRDSTALHLHDIQYCGATIHGGKTVDLIPIHSAVLTEDNEPGALERMIIPPLPPFPTSFNWHPAHQNRLLCINHQGILMDHTVYERITIGWSANSTIAWNHSAKSIKYHKASDTIMKNLDDLTPILKKRAVMHYGLVPELSQNGELADNEQLENLWNWLYLSQTLVEDGIILTKNRHPGVLMVLKLDVQPEPFIKSELIQRPWTDIGSKIHTARLYRSPDRDRALLLCGWRFEPHGKEPSTFADEKNVLFLDRLEREGSYSRAVAIAVWNLCLRHAIDILNRGASKGPATASLNVVAMALSGFSEDSNSMWREMCVKSRALLTDPYLRATFAFLTADNDQYDAVLNESGISVQDRVAFALLYLSDAKLADYLKKLMMKLTDEGNLAGFLLTGATADGTKLLSRYLHITKDVQSCALIAIRCLPHPLLGLPEVTAWIDSYRELLNSWKMWHERAHFDIAMRAVTKEKPPPQMYVTCSFCGKSISQYMRGYTRVRNSIGRLGVTVSKLKLSSCPSCRKPLPRCAICLMHMGVITGVPGSFDGPPDEDAPKLTDFASGFTWCQTCRHGGHTEHIMEWFESHTECPVSGCTCRCSALDEMI